MTIFDNYPGDAVQAIFTCDWPYRLRDLKDGLETLPGKLLAGHMPNLDLDVTKLMRSHLQKLLLTDNAMKEPDSHHARLLTLFLRRLSKEASLLLHKGKELNLNKKGITRHINGQICEGCPDCNGPDWHHKSASVAMLWALCCHCCTRPEAHHIAAVAVDAVYSPLTQDEHCKHILL